MAEVLTIDPKSSLGIHLQRDLVIDVLQLLSLRLDEVGVVVLDRSEFVELSDLRDLLKNVRDDIFEVIEYKSDPDGALKPQLGDPDYDPESEAYAG